MITITVCVVDVNIKHTDIYRWKKMHANIWVCRNENSEFYFLKNLDFESANT